MPRIPVLAFVPALFCCSTLAVAAPAPVGPVLPHTFAGWTETAAPQSISSPADAAVMQEYGLTQSVSADYASGARRLTVRAWLFQDATGAYGAFTFYRQPEMRAGNLGRASAASGDHVLFWSGATVIDATFAHPVPKEDAVLSALAAELPKAQGTQGVPPSLPDYLPKAQLNATSVHYVIGPVAWSRLGSAVPASAIDFSQDAEAVVARYGAATLTLVMYPTPQIAGAHLKTIDALPKSLGLTAGRTGPLLAIVSAVPRAQAVPLLQQVSSTTTSPSIIPRAMFRRPSSFTGCSLASRCSSLSFSAPQFCSDFSSVAGARFIVSSVENPPLPCRKKNSSLCI